MRVVADAGPLIHLSWIDRLDLLGRLYEEVLVCPTVQREVLAAPPGTRGLEALRGAFASAPFSVRGTTGPQPELPLDPGERESIALALESTADLVLVDEQAGRREARRMGLRVGGTLGVLVEARRRGFLPALSPDVEALRRYGYWLSPRLVALVTAGDVSSSGDEGPQ